MITIQEALASGPPHSPDIETTILGCAFVSPECLDRVLERCEPDDFHVPRNRALFAVVRDLRREGGAVDRTAAIERIQATVRDPDERTVLVDALFAALEDVAVAVPETVDHHARRLRDYSDARFLRDLGIHAIAAAEPARDPQARLAEFATDALRRCQSRDTGRLRHIYDVASRLADALQEPETLRIAQCFTGFRDLDLRFGPVHAGWFTLICGRPSMGKTALALKIALNTARAGWPTLVETLELDDLEAAARILAPDSGIGARQWRDPRTAAEESAMQQILSAVNASANLPLYLAHKRATVPTVRRDVQTIAAKHGRPPVTIVDRFELLGENLPDHGNRNQQLSATSAALRALAREEEIPLFVLAQLNRECERREDKRPRLADLRDTGSLEQDAVRVIGVYRDEYYGRTAENAGKAELIVLKNMQGKVGTADVCFRTEFPTFADLADEGRWGS